MLFMVCLQLRVGLLLLLFFLEIISKFVGLLIHCWDDVFFKTREQNAAEHSRLIKMHRREAMSLEEDNITGFIGLF